MSGIEEDTLPPWTWRLLGAVAVGLLLAAVAGIALISAGVFDPKPLGPLKSQTAPGERAVAAGEQRLEWTEQPLPQAPFSARLLGAHIDGESDVGYGLALGAPETHLVVAVSPLGYVAVWEERASERLEHMPWQTWPHVRRGGEPNEIQLDVQDGHISARLNRELLWEGAWQSPDGNIGLYVESFGDAARIEFSELTLFH